MASTGAATAAPCTWRTARPGHIYAFDFDGREGTLSSGRILLALAPDVGAPDGLTVDAPGDLWVAIYGGGCVRRYTPGGELREIRRVPARQSTSCAFAGDRLDRLYVTTATEGWSDAERRADPAAGLVYRLDPDAVGVTPRPIRPEPAWWATIIGDGVEPASAG